MAENIREEIQQNRSKDLEVKTQQKFMTAKELLENQDKVRQVKNRLFFYRAVKASVRLKPTSLRGGSRCRQFHRCGQRIE